MASASRRGKRDGFAFVYRGNSVIRKNTREQLSGYTNISGPSDINAVGDLVQLFEYIPDVQFWIKDPEGRFLAANQTVAP